MNIVTEFVYSNSRRHNPGIVGNIYPALLHPSEVCGSLLVILTANIQKISLCLQFYLFVFFPLKLKHVHIVVFLLNPNFHILSLAELHQNLSLYPLVTAQVPAGVQAKKLVSWTTE